MIKTETTRVSSQMQIDIQAAVLTSFRASWKWRSSSYSRSRVRENLALLRFLRTHDLMARKYSFVS